MVVTAAAFVTACSAQGTPASSPTPWPVAIRVSAPAGAAPQGPSTFWRVATPSHAYVTMEKYDAQGSGPHPTVVLFPGSPGWGAADESSAARWAARGFTAIAVCWFRVEPVPYTGIDCPGGPPFTGVSSRALREVKAAVEAVHRLPGVDPTRVALVGFSRGGGIVALLAATGWPDPVVTVSGLFDPKTFSGRLAGERNVLPLAGGIRAPTLLQYGRDDTFVPWRTNSRSLARAVAAAGHAPAPVVLGYPGGHGISSQQVIDDEYQFVARTLRHTR